jgi:muramidase (phage lysozyme)
MNDIPRPAKTLLRFISRTETGEAGDKAYETVFGHNQAKLPKKLTAMTLDEWIKAGPGWTKKFGSSAAGAFQFMRKTLIGLKDEMDLTGSETMDAGMQDRLGFYLLQRRGYDAFVAGRRDRIAFAKALAQEWASFPVLADTQGAHRRVKRGETYYAGDQLNRALVSPEQIEAVLATVRAQAGQEDEDAAEARPPAKPEGEKKISHSKRFWTWLTTGLGGAAAWLNESGLLYVDRWVLLAILAVIVGFAVYAIVAMPAVRARLGLKT